MVRSLSAELRKQAQARETDEVFVVLMTIAHPSISPPIRVANDTQDLVSRGMTFIGFPFDIVLPDDGDGVPKATLTVQNVDRKIGEAIELMADPARVTLEIVRLSDPNTVEISYENFLLRNVRGDYLQVQGEISFDDYSVEPWPYIRATKAYLPGAWKVRT